MLMLGPMPASVRDAVRQLIAERPNPDPDERRYGLMLHGGPGGCTYLDGDGDVWRLYFAFFDEPETVEHVPDGPMKVGDVAIAAHCLPELAAWLPRRPDAASNCSGCNGTGWFRDVFQCPRCHGMGWIPEE